MALDGLGEDPDMLPFGIVEAGMETVAALLPFRQMLDENPAGDMPGVVDGEPDDARKLLRLAEIILRCLAERASFERNDPLVSFLGQRMVEGDGEVALAEEGGEVAVGR
jgi:hypothetical protein